MKNIPLILFFLLLFFIIKKRFFDFTDYKLLLEKGGVIIDVRSNAEFASGNIENSINIPLSEINKVDKLIDDKYHWDWDGNRMDGSYDSDMDLNKSTNNVYHHAFVEIVTECSFYNESYDTIQMTDKTFKPIVNLTPFIMASSTGHLKVLKKLGYKTFDFLIDESYDEVEDPIKRLKMIKDEITRLSEMDLSEIKRIYIQNFDILLYNKELYKKRQNVKIRHDLRKYYDKFLT